MLLINATAYIVHLFRRPNAIYGKMFVVTVFIQECAGLFHNSLFTWQAFQNVLTLFVGESGYFS